MGSKQSAGGTPSFPDEYAWMIHKSRTVCKYRTDL